MRAEAGPITLGFGDPTHVDTAASPTARPAHGQPVPRGPKHPIRSANIGAMSELIRYHDTRGLDSARCTFTTAVMKGIADGGGLFVPDTLPSLSLSEILGMQELTYAQRAARIAVAFGVDIGSERLGEITAEAYGAAFSDPRIAPVTEVAADMHVLELWHGPTSAFKDMALQVMPRMFSEAIEMRRRAFESGDPLPGGEVVTRPVDDFLVLVATSGDTGKAALDGFADRPHTRIAVFYPADGVSDIQRLQMITQTGDNVAVFGVRGNFDDCQNAVKAAFSDTDFGARLHAGHGLSLSSANSINWGRLLPQIVYYVSAYADMVADGGVKPGDEIDVCVPTGNFGNVLGAWYAREMGVPIGRLLCASNENNVLTDFIATGVYDIADRAFVTTPSPSMDILVSSNLERLLWELTHDADAVRGWMAQLATAGRFQVDRDTFRKVREVFAGDFATNEESLATVRRVWSECGYLLDPHTAVAWEVAERLRDTAPVLVVSTAHWAKFGTDVYKALAHIPYDAPLPADAAACSGVELLAKIQGLAPDGACAPRALAELDDQPARFIEVVDPGRDAVESAVELWLTR
jgi:threonine synthase